MKPLWECAAKLTHPKQPAYMNCPSLVFPAWTKKRIITWKPSERVIPGWSKSAAEEMGTLAYVAAFDKLNNLIPAMHCEQNLKAAA